MQCKILRSFRYSEDGINAKQANEGEMVDIPGNLVAGLEEAGYLILERKNAGAAPENKMAHIQENKTGKQRK